MKDFSHIKEKLKGNIIMKKILALLLSFTVFMTMSACNKDTENGNEWAIDEACTEVKGQVYSEYGEMPSGISGSILYKNGQDYIVIVSYKLKEFGWEGQVACHVYGYRKSNCFVKGTTKEMPKGYEFGIEEIKALWRIE